MEAYIDYKPGYIDTAAVVNPSKPSYSAYAPPAPKKKKKVEKARYRQRTFGSAPETAGQRASGCAGSDSRAPAQRSIAGGCARSGHCRTDASDSASEPTTAEPTTGQVGAPGKPAEDQVGVANPSTLRHVLVELQQLLGGKEHPSRQQFRDIEARQEGEDPLRSGSNQDPALDNSDPNRRCRSERRGRFPGWNGMAPETQVAANGDRQMLQDSQHTGCSREEDPLQRPRECPEREEGERCLRLILSRRRR